MYTLKLYDRKKEMLHISVKHFPIRNNIAPITNFPQLLQAHPDLIFFFFLQLLNVAQTS